MLFINIIYECVHEKNCNLFILKIRLGFKMYIVHIVFLGTQKKYRVIKLATFKCIDYYHGTIL